MCGFISATHHVAREGDTDSKEYLEVPRRLRAERIVLAMGCRFRLTVPAEESLTHDITLSMSRIRMRDTTVTVDPVSRAGGELVTASVIERDAIEHRRSYV